MPTYDYACDACDHTFEEFQSIKAEPLIKCPECGKRKLRRLFGTGAAILFKGSGFYETDYRSQSYKDGEKAETEKSTDKTSDKSDTGKPDTAKSDSAKSDSAKSDKGASKPPKTEPKAKES